MGPQSGDRTCAVPERLYADGLVIDFTSPGFSGRCSISEIGPFQTPCRACGRCSRSEAGCRWISDPWPARGTECSFWSSALGSAETAFLHDLHQHCRAACATCIGGGQEFLTETALDYEGFYSLRGLAIVGTQVGLAAVLANTSLDRDFQDWHDHHVRSSDTDRFADWVRWPGEGKIMIPVFAGAAILDCFADDDEPLLQAIGGWGNRCSRSVLVGGPTVLGLAYLLGASRPCEDRGSAWKIFDDNNSVSGHAFVGATPFLNAAYMTDSVPLKAALYGLSALPAWSRVNDRAHYLSQALLGWGIAWLAADVVDRTERCRQNWVIVPYSADGGLGFQSIVTF